MEGSRGEMSDVSWPIAINCVGPQLSIGCYNQPPSTGGGQTECRGPRSVNPIGTIIPKGFKFSVLSSSLALPTSINLAGRKFEAEEAAGKQRRPTGTHVANGSATDSGQVVQGDVPSSSSILRMRADSGRPELVAWGPGNLGAIDIDTQENTNTVELSSGIRRNSTLTMKHSLHDSVIRC